MDTSRLESALRNADAAGDVEAARRLANELKRMRSETPAPQASAVTPPDAPESPVNEDTRGILLPLARNEAGEVVFALPGFLKGGVDVVRGILDGEITPDNITGKQMVDLSGLVGGSSAAGGTGKQIARELLAPRALKPQTAVTEAGKRLGVDLPRGITSQSPTVKQVGKIVQAVPGGGTPMRQASEKAIDDLGAAQTGVQESAGSGSVVQAADTLTKGITEYAGKGGVLAERVAEKYRKVEALVDGAATARLTKTAEIVDTLTARRTAAGLPGRSKAIDLVTDAVTRPEGLTYKGAQDLRTYVGEILGKPGLLPADISEAELKQVYKALTEDLRGIVQKTGGDRAVQAWEAANKAALKTAAIQEKLAAVIETKGGEGAIFSRIEGMAGVSGRADIRGLAKVRAAIGKDDWEEVASAMIARLGKETDAATFSPERFVTGYAKLSPEAKRVLFETGKQGKKLRESLDDIAMVSQQMKSLREFANPSGTGQTVAGAGLGTGLVGGFLFEPTAFLTSIGSVVGARILSNVLAKPAGAAPLATLARAGRALALKPSTARVGTVKDAAAALAYRIAVEEGLNAADEKALADTLTNTVLSQTEFKT